MSSASPQLPCKEAASGANTGWCWAKAWTACAAQSRTPAFLRGEDGALAYSALPLLAGDSLVGARSPSREEAIASAWHRRAVWGRALEETLLEIAAAAADEIAQAKREAQMSIRATEDRRHQ